LRFGGVNLADCDVLWAIAYSEQQEDMKIW
jgi:hypothetical protein